MLSPKILNKSLNNLIHPTRRCTRPPLFAAQTLYLYRLTRPNRKALLVIIVVLVVARIGQCLIDIHRNGEFTVGGIPAQPSGD
jgi:hypothetical protein